MRHFNIFIFICTVRSQPGPWHITATFPSTLKIDVLHCLSDADENIFQLTVCAMPSFSTATAITSLYVQVVLLPYDTNIRMRRTACQRANWWECSVLYCGPSGPLPLCPWECFSFQGYPTVKLLCNAKGYLCFSFWCQWKNKPVSGLLGGGSCKGRKECWVYHFRQKRKVNFLVWITKKWAYSQHTLMLFCDSWRRGGKVAMKPGTSNQNSGLLELCMGSFAFSLPAIYSIMFTVGY